MIQTINKLTEQQIPKLLKKLEKQFLDELAEEYERQKERKRQDAISYFEQ